MNLADVNIALDHKIVAGSEFQWHCYPDARYLDYETEHAYASVLFCPNTQIVYSATVNKSCDSTVRYRWLNSKYKQAYFDEAKNRNVDPNIAWDNLHWIDCETQKDFLAKAKAIMNDLPFDDRIEIELYLSDDEFLNIARLAHEKDISINKFIEHTLQVFIDSQKNLSTKEDAHAL